MPGVKIADSHDKIRWDDFVISHEDAGPYHLFAWKEAVESAYGHRSYYLITEDQGGGVQGVLPLIHVKLPFLKGTLVSLPFCDYGGILALSEEAKEILFQAAIELAAKLKARLEIRLKAPDPLFEGSQRLRVLSHKVRMVLDLPESSETLWNGFKSKLRSQIKRPQKDGLEFTLGSADLVDDFYCVFSANMRDLGSPVHSKAWIDAVVQSFSARAHIGVVYAASKPVASGILLVCNGMGSTPWASALSEYNRSSPNMLIYWGFLKYASDHGIKRFDFGRSTSDEGTYKFKEQWGAVPFPLYWYGDGFSSASGHEGTAGKIRPVIEKVWSRMPQKFADTLGPMVRKYITL